MTSAKVFNAKLDKTSKRDFTFFMLTKRAQKYAIGSGLQKADIAYSDTALSEKSMNLRNCKDVKQRTKKYEEGSHCQQDLVLRQLEPRKLANYCN